MAEAAKKEIAKVEPTMSERFTNMVVKEFSGTAGMLSKFGEKQRRLAQHLFIKVDASLKVLETKRAERQPDKAPIIWQNVNMNKLAMDSVHRIELGLDALIPNHISIIPYFNSREKKYDIDLRIGYVGKDYYRRNVALESPVDIVYELVYSNDKFVPIKRGKDVETESYTFEIASPFDRGEIVGGFGYIIYNDPRKNKLVIVTEKDFIKSKNHAQDKSFWEKNPVEMRYKTIVNRVTDKLIVDPDKVTAAYSVVEDAERSAEEEIHQNANAEVIDITPKKNDDSALVDEPKQESAPQPENNGPDF